VTELDRLPPSEARKLLALAAMTLKGRQRAPEVVAVIRMNGASLDEEEVRPLVRALSHRLLERKRSGRGQQSEDGLGPLVVDLEDLRQDLQVASQTIRSTEALYQSG
jgi:hypothetical protein